METEIKEVRGKKYNTKKVDLYLEDLAGKVVVNKKNVIAPDFWSTSAVQIAASKYFNISENSIFDMVERVVSAIEAKAPSIIKEKYPNIFNELSHSLITQRGSFNSPVWFNVGTSEEPAVSACYILQLEDTLDSILSKFEITGNIFKGGAGAGMSGSALREEGANLSKGGRASGPISFLTAFDSAAGVIKSGGRLRRSANLYNLLVTHPDILKFIDVKAREEDKARTLLNTGLYGQGMDSEAYASVSFQNVNLSVAVTDSFMEAVKSGSVYDLISPSTNTVTKTLDARSVFTRIAEKAHKCGDPGLQFIDTINAWHTVPNAGRINATNPCSEYAFIDESACNLASLNLAAYYDVDTDTFDWEQYKKDVSMFIIMQDLLVDIGFYPTKEIRKNVIKYRALGLGYASLGSVLMRMGLSYDSEEAREFAKEATRVLTHTAYKTSQDLCDIFSHNMTKKDQETLREIVINKHGFTDFDERPFRNAQVSLLAPTGTISFLMDCDSTGVEPMVALVSYKALSGGGIMKLVPSCTATALRKLGYSSEEGEKYILEHETIKGFVRDEHLPVFQAALGDNTVSTMGHIKMMAAVQPYLSGAISKTVNIPSSCTVKDIEDIYFKSWEMGLKAISIYRDGSKIYAPITVKSKKEEKEIAGDLVSEEELTTEELVNLICSFLDNTKNKIGYKDRQRIIQKLRRRLPDVRNSITHKFKIGEHEGYLQLGFYESGNIGEVFIQMAKEGSTLSGVMDAFATALSIALQHGLPMELFAEKFIGTRFEPSGWTSDPRVQNAKSILDYIFRWISMYNDIRKKYESHNDAVVEVIRSSDPSFFEEEPVLITEKPKSKIKIAEDGNMCANCGSITQRSGSCYVCPACGSTTGCGG